MASPAQIALAWVLHQDGVIAIPKASTPDHVRQNRVAHDIRLEPDDLEELDRLFPKPTRKHRSKCCRREFYRGGRCWVRGLGGPGASTLAAGAPRGVPIQEGGSLAGNETDAGQIDGIGRSPGPSTDPTPFCVPISCRARPCQEAAGPGARPVRSLRGSRRDGDAVLDLGNAGARHAARSASRRSAQDRTVPVRVTCPPSAVTFTRSASTSAMRLSAASILALISERATRDFSATRLEMPLTPRTLRTAASARLR